MVKRSKDWNAGLAKDLRDFEFAAQFIIATIEEGASLQEALGKVIRLYGIHEFSEVAKMASPNIIRAINTRYNPTQKTLCLLLKPFGLTISVRPEYFAREPA
ncbi:MAG: hypothetical protein WCK42_05120 [Myxococcaceae bacterium]